MALINWTDGFDGSGSRQTIVPFEQVQVVQDEEAAQLAEEGAQGLSRARKKVKRAEKDAKRLSLQLYGNLQVDLSALADIADTYKDLLTLEEQHEVRSLINMTYMGQKVSP